jgi:hypothetical protein
MNSPRAICFCLATLLATLSTKAQGTFQNLNFEEANPVIVDGSPYYPYGVTSASALPNWTVSIGGVPQTQIVENDPSLGAPSVMLAGPGDAFGFPPIDGNYSVLLQGSFSSSVPAISQTGLIPAGTQSLYFEAQTGTGALDVLVGNQDVPFAAVGSGPNYTLYGANISAWSGQTEQLTFAAQESTMGLSDWEIDDISFSSQAVPEPSPLALTGVGALVFALYRRYAPKRPFEARRKFIP